MTTCDGAVNAIDSFSINTTHSVNTLVLRIDNTIPSSKTIAAGYYFYFRDLKIYYDECYETCAICSGPSETQCSSCPVNAPIPVGG